jgi:hypothetical protein
MKSTSYINKQADISDTNMNILMADYSMDKKTNSRYKYNYEDGPVYMYGG